MLKELEKKKLLDGSDLCEIFHSGCKQEFQIGLEFEKLAVYQDELTAVSYEDISSVIDGFEQQKWTKVVENSELMGLTSDVGHISLEPGSQFELSLNPLDDIHQIKYAIDGYNIQTTMASENSPISWLGYGIQPVSTYENINVIPKQRYGWMTQYLPTKGKSPFVMMRETAGIQVSLDYKSETDAIEKLSLALKLSPIVSAMYANSPIRNSRLTGYKSFRARSWLDTDNQRCGLVSRKLFGSNLDFSFNDYVQILLDVPMIFIERDGISISVGDLTFRTFIKQGYNGVTANLDDWNTHLSLYFPDVRLKNYIEIRNHDCQRANLIPSIPAIWKGIMCNNDSIEAAKSLLNGLSYEDFEELRHKTPIYGLDYSIKNMKLHNIAKELINIAYKSLKNNNIGEEIHLEPIKELVKNKLTPADIIIQKWCNEWNRDPQKLVDYSRIY